MKKYIFLFIILIETVNIRAGSFVVWQGFSNYWTYNHRLNRLGDYVAQSSLPNNELVTLAHAAATGLGKDSAYFNSKYAIVNADNISFFAGKINIELSGKEGNRATIKKEITLNPTEDLQQQEAYATLLNGFDIVTIGGADKLKFLELKIEDRTYNTSTNSLTFSITASIETNCTSLECNLFQNNYKYSIDIHYLLLGGKKINFSTTETNYKQQLKWDTKTEIKPVLSSNTLEINQKYNARCLAYKNISILLDKEHHYLGYENSISNVKVDDKKISYTQHLFYSNWTYNMKQSIASGGQAKFANKKPGWCILEGTLSLIEFNGNVDYKERNGGMYWIGKNKPANSDAALNIQTIKIEK